MRHIGRILAYFLLFSYLTPSVAESQYDLNKTACEQLKKADDALNNVYQQVIARYKEDRVFINQFTTAQKNGSLLEMRMWLQCIFLNIRNLMALFYLCVSAICLNE